MEKIKTTNEVIAQLVSDIASCFADGKTITHEWLRTAFNIEQLSISDYDSTEEFVEALQAQQFAYMNLVDRVRWKLLEQEKLYLRNVRGDGYIIMKPQEQTTYGYNNFVRALKSAIKEADAIMSNVRQVPDEQQALDNDLRAKYAMMKQMMNNARKSYVPTHYREEHSAIAVAI